MLRILNKRFLSAKFSINLTRRYKSFFNAGNHQIDLQIFLMDESGRWWRSGAEKECIYVRCGDEQARIQLQINNQNSQARSNRR